MGSSLYGRLPVLVDTGYLGLMYERLFTFLSWVPPARAFNVYILVAFFSARAFGIARSTAVLYVVLSVLATWLSHNAMYIKDGMVNWLLATHFWALATGMVWRFLLCGGVILFVLLSLIVIVLPYIHQVTLPLLGLSFCVAALFARSYLTGARVLGLVLLCAGAYVVHCEWLQDIWMLLPAFDLTYVSDDYKTFIVNPYFSLLDLVDPFKLAVFLYCGIRVWYRMRRTGHAQPSCSGSDRHQPHKLDSSLHMPRRLVALLCGLFFFLAYVSPFVVDMTKANNLRFSVPFLNLLLLLVTEHLSRTLLFRRGRTGLWWKGALMGAAMGFFLAGLAYTPKVLKTTYPLEFEELVRVLSSRTDPSARILLEDGAHLFNRNDYEGGHPLFGGHLFARLPLMVEREFIGGPHSIASIKEHYATFQNGHLLGKPLSQWTSHEFLETAQQYNLGWIVCWHDDSKAFFAGKMNRSLEKIASIGQFEVYRLLRNHSFLIGATGEVYADYNRIAIRGLKLEQGSTSAILLYHWNDHYESSPAAAIRRVVINDDPVGFIEIVDPPSDVELRFTGGVLRACICVLGHF